MSFRSYGRPVEARGRQRRAYNNRSSNRRAKQYIHPSRFVKAAKPVEEVHYEIKHAFADFAMADLLKANLEAKGITTPTPIQDQTVALGLEGKDIVGIANTGTGKTIAFGLPILDRLVSDSKSRALVVAPTRELAQQIEAEFRLIGKGGGFSGALLIGGTAMGPQLRDLRADPRIVIGTPGRIKDHIERRTLNLSKFNMVALDEVDRMLDMGFIADMQNILEELAPERQSFFFSATMDRKVEDIINTFSKNPVTVSVKTGETSDNVEQNVVQYGSKHEKIERLHDLLIKGEVSKALIFDETQRDVERLSDELSERGFDVEAIHGGKTQGHRQRALDKFKRNHVNILVATDVAARGIDVADITHVINYATPQSYEDYVHRIGRAGRAGRTGNALTFIER